MISDMVQNAWAVSSITGCPGTLIVGTKKQVKLQRWHGGSVVVAWPTRRALDSFRHVMTRADQVLLIEWAPDAEVMAWLKAEEAIAVPVEEAAAQ
ncbi:hypothetical protein [Micromonospora sp. ATA51]|uniref:hypothetical protein n=1 Tax=Micromonospora sp. ATA51 TaxID=2806098 RepID=UPI001A58C1EF|nr:hypothetical protein [Micromonospora sp. ATA51]MBM0229244.1 hypothetical protein [Micromonospora sp. ATA51]